MLLKNKQHLKSYILVLLILFSLLQMGILWNINGRGFSFFSHTPVLLPADIQQTASNKFFSPYRVVISKGSDSRYNSPFWMIDRTHSLYNKLWSDAKSYLSHILQSGQGQVLPDGVWETLISRENKMFIFEFKTNIGQSLLSWFLNVSSVSSTAPTGLYKVMISPEDEMNYGSNVIYINDGRSVYKYTVEIPEDGLSKDEYDDIFKTLQSENNLLEYSVIRQQYGSVISISDDILGLIKKPAYNSYKSAVCYLPDEMKPPKGYSPSEVETVANKLLGPEKDSYDSSVDKKGTIEFKTLNDIYSIYKDGFLEYKYLPYSQKIDKGDLKDAFLNAYDMLERLKGFVQGGTYYLSGINYDNKTCYEFMFDLVVDDTGMPVYFNCELPNFRNKVLGNALIIKANGKNVVECTGILRSFKPDIIQNQYDISFLTLMEEVPRSLIRGIKNIQLHEIYISYEVRDTVDNIKLYPVWVMKTSKGDYAIPIHQK